MTIDNFYLFIAILSIDEYLNLTINQDDMICCRILAISSLRSPRARAEVALSKSYRSLLTDPWSAR
jgi:hypothetical protein